MSVSKVWRSRSVLVAFALAVLVPAAHRASAAEAEGKESEPARVVVQHILVAFKKSVPDKKIERTKKEAEALAQDLLRRARAGEDFDALVVEYSADRPPGKMILVNRDQPKTAGSRGRDEVVPKFGDVAFSLEVGEIGLAEYSYGGSPYGWHVIKRLE
jgi:foldase protein PrsA